MALAGLILGWVGLVIFLLFVALIIWTVASDGQTDFGGRTY